MPLTLPLPDWVPWWVQLAIVVVAILFGFAFLMMPFAVFGLKGRLEMLEAQLDDVHAELRMLATRLPEADRRPARPVEREAVAEDITPRPRPARPRPQPVPPVPVPPAPVPVERPLPTARRPRDANWLHAPSMAEDRNEDQPARRPLGTSPLRGADSDRELNRSEPTLRWPPR